MNESAADSCKKTKTKTKMFMMMCVVNPVFFYILNSVQMNVTVV